MKTILRNFLTTLRRFKLASTLNIVGLGVAFAAFLIIIMQVHYQYSYDKCYQNSDRIYRADLMGGDGGGQIVVSQPMVDTYGPLSPLVENYTLVAPPFADSYVTIENAGQKVGFTVQCYGAYASFADVFTPQMVEGSAASLKEPTNILLPESMAIRFFGRSTGVVGAKVTLTNGQGSKVDYQVGGVYVDWPDNTQLQNNLIYPVQPNKESNWGECNYLMFVTLGKGVDPQKVQADFKRNFNLTEKADWMSHDAGIELTKLTDIYYDDRQLWAGDLAESGDESTTSILLAIAILIVVVAAINFINFSTSLAPLRIKSINIQKVLGSTDTVLRTMLVVEAVGIALLASGLGIVIVDFLSLTSLSDIILGGITLAGNGSLVTATVVVAFVVGLLSGIYPAFYTTKFPPVMVLQGSFASSPAGRILRMVLIGFQFVVSIGLIIGAIFLQLQNSHLRNANTGIDMENVAIVKLAGELTKSKSFEQNLRSSAQITNVGFSFAPIGVGNLQQGWGKIIKDKQVQFDAIVVSWNVPQMLGVKLLNGNYFTADDAIKAKRTFIFNTKASKEFDITSGDNFVDWQNNDTTAFAEIRGICSDINYKSLHTPIGNMAFVVEGTAGPMNSMPICYIAIKGDPYTAVEHIKRTAAAIDPAYPLDIVFYDTAFNSLYQKDKQTTGLITLFSMLAIIISLVGVFGLVVFETQYRRREVGLRKVYGSTVMQVLVMFNRRFVWLVVVCFVIAAPLAYFGVSQWLAGFVSRVPMHWWVFGLALAIVMAITILTVTIQSYRAATENPVVSIKS